MLAELGAFLKSKVSTRLYSYASLYMVLVIASLAVLTTKFTSLLVDRPLRELHCLFGKDNLFFSELFFQKFYPLYSVCGRMTVCPILYYFQPDGRLP